MLSVGEETPHGFVRPQPVSFVCECPEDFDVFLHAILMTHPGLDFLLDTQAVGPWSHVLS